MNKVNRFALLIVVMLLVASMAPIREDNVSVAAQDPVMPAQELNCRPAVILSIPFGGGVVYFQDTANCLNTAGSVYECTLEVPPMSDPMTFRSEDFREVWNRSVAYDCDIFGTCLAQNEPTLVCRNIEPRNYGAAD
jgi:hypothetical protein